MAKIVGLVGAVSGKVGNFVGAVVGGVQTMRVYQPIVANPRTTAQVKQRSRVDLAGQLSSAISKVAIEGLAGNARMRRSALLSNLIKSTSTTITTLDGKATLIGSSVIFSKGGVVPGIQVGEVAVEELENERAGVQIPFTKIGSAEGDYADHIRFVALAVPKSNAEAGSKPMSVVYDSEVPATGNKTVNFTLATTTPSYNYVVFLYAIPMKLQNASALSWGYIEGIQQNGQIELNGSENTSGAYRFGDSLYVNAYPVPTE